MKVATMNLWNTLYDKFKDARNGALFLATLSALLLALFLGFLVEVLWSNLSAAALSNPYLPVVLTGIGGLLGVLGVFLKMRPGRKRELRRLAPGPLSRDELRVARSK